MEEYPDSWLRINYNICRAIQAGKTEITLPLSKNHRKYLLSDGLIVNENTISWDTPLAMIAAGRTYDHFGWKYK